MTSSLPVLAIDTSGAVSVAVLTAGGRVAARHRYDPRAHAELAVPFVEAVLSEADVGRRDLAALAVGTGPGPFTGLRVGLVTARVLALALGVPVVGVPSLDALAAEVVVLGLVAAGEEFVVATDARRREVYWGRYRADPPGVQRLSGPSVTAPAAVELSGARCFGRGAALYAAVLDPVGHALGGPMDPSASWVARLAARDLAAGRPGLHEPLYLRRPDAVVPGEPKRVSP